MYRTPLLGVRDGALEFASDQIIGIMTLAKYENSTCSSTLTVVLIVYYIRNRDKCNASQKCIPCCIRELNFI
ncbi:Ubiquitin-like-specific protease ESD4 [Gossypium australe]|uniref:Ubiquitin-like-specific protease ESD4 n=1 Tax=Gossypium australe TaxID=47621 RepID=A0A5B6VF79_9ROSI|nr:Ubiquitin-like-specific protease ESD4 [Gossypium australe]